MLEVKNLTHFFGDKKVLDGLDFRIESGKILSLLGPSGTGKSTLLDCIAGFLKPNFGEINIHGKLILDSNKNTFVPPEKRRVGLIFQSPNLFPHLNLYDNVSFGLERDKDEISKYWLELLGLKDCGNKFPHEISGGEQQRVAIARALAPNPRLCLLDEPFSKLDTYLKKRVRTEVKEFLKDKSCTSIVVTHDFQEALEVGDDLAFLTDGKFYHLGSCSKFDLQNLPQELKHFFH
jgi:iron(III) transport system ATP-binding protein